jgi:elongation factor Ts
MATVDAAAVKKLREMTDAGIMDCKKALAESSGDFEQAVKILREKKMIVGGNRGDRATGEGSIGVYVSEDGKRAALIEVNCETDFVGKNEKFQALITDLAKQAATGSASDVQSFLAEPFANDSSKTVDQHIKEFIGTIGENIVVARVAHFETSGVLGSYRHTDGKKAAIVELQVENADDRKMLEGVARDVAMQSVAMRAPYLHRDHVPSEMIAAEQEIYRKQAAEEGKPEAMLDKIAAGRLNKFYSDNTLLEQAFVINGETGKRNVTQYVQATAGDGAQVVRFARFNVGEGQSQ